MSAERKSPLRLDFLRDIYYVQARLDFEVLEEAALPPFPGSALRGVFGHALRKHLCSAKPGCAGACAQPDTCQYYALFERNREAGEGGNLPKSLILDPPVPWELEQIALGSPPEFPYEVEGADANGLPRLVNQHWRGVPQGCEFGVRVTLLGQAGALLPVLIAVLQQEPMHVGGGLFRLCRAVDTAMGGRILWDRTEGFPVQAAMRQDLGALLLEPRTPENIVIGFLTPVRLRAGAGEYCFSGQELARHFWEAALVRAMRVRDTFCKTGDRLPWMELPAAPELKTHRVYRYVLPRLSLRQKAFMEFDGLVGNAGYFATGEFVALARAVEILHIGQKSSFGLGRIRCIRLGAA